MSVNVLTQTLMAFVYFLNKQQSYSQSSSKSRCHLSIAKIQTKFTYHIIDFIQTAVSCAT